MRISGQNPWILPIILVVVTAALGGAAIAKGGYYLGKHEGDTLHLLQIVLRMAEGQLPHLDFMTPIGILAFAPISLLIGAGWSAGQALMTSQVIVAVILLPVIWRAAASRFAGLLALAFGGVVLVLVLGLVHGEAQRSISFSMHYNRWAWAVSFLAIALAILPPLGRARPVLDGILIGLLLSVLALMKATYFVAFALPVAVALLARRDLAGLAAMIGAGVAVIAAVTLVLGLPFWLAYVQDLLQVAGSDVRPQPGEAFDAVLGAPAYIGGSILAIASVILLRQSGRDVPGLVMLLLVPGFFYVTFQNFGNDPQWLLLLALLLLALRPGPEVENAWGWNMRLSMTLAGAMAFALTAASFFNLAYSPFRHLAMDVADYTPLLPGSARHGDLQTDGIRANNVDFRQALSDPGPGLERAVARADRLEIGTLFGEELPRCELVLGMSAWFDAVVSDLIAEGHAGKRIFAADVFNSYWLFGDLRPLERGAPWYYGGLPGFDSADLLIVPLCPVALDVRRQVLEAVEASGAPLREIRRTSLYVLFEKTL